MTLPGADRAFVHPDKVGAYLLVLNHPQGQSKAHAFVKAGFSLDSARTLADQFRLLARSGVARGGSRSTYGRKYEIDGMIQSPSGALFGVRTVWIVRFGEDFPRFVTAYPRRLR